MSVVQRLLIVGVVILFVIIITIVSIQNALRKKQPNQTNFGPTPTLAVSSSRARFSLKKTVTHSSSTKSGTISQNSSPFVLSIQEFQEAEKAAQSQLPLIVDEEDMNELNQLSPLPTSPIPFIAADQSRFEIEYSDRLGKYIVTTVGPNGAKMYTDWLSQNPDAQFIFRRENTIVTAQTVQELHYALDVAEIKKQTPEQQAQTDAKAFLQVLNSLLGFSGMVQDTIQNLSSTQTTMLPPEQSSSDPSQENKVQITSSPTPTIPSLQETTSCSQLDTVLSQYALPYRSGYSGTPRTNTQIHDFSRTKTYAIPYRNTSCTVSEQSILKAYEKIKAFYPTYWKTSQLLTHWQLVQEKAKQYGFNPIFLISLWLEESAAGGATQATQFGCDFLKNPDGTWTTLRGKPSNICDQLQCFFPNTSAKPRDYVEFACSYQYGRKYCVAQNGLDCYQCKKDPSFVRVVEFWYTFLSQDQPQSCKASYCPGLEGC